MEKNTTMNDILEWLNKWERKGALILVSGRAASGKSTFISKMVEAIKQTLGKINKSGVGVVVVNRDEMKAKVLETWCTSLNGLTEDDKDKIINGSQNQKIILYNELIKTRRSSRVTYKGKKLSLSLDEYIRNYIDASLRSNIVIIDSMICLYAKQLALILPGSAKNAFRVGVHVVRDFESHPLTQDDANRWGLSLKEQLQLSGFPDFPFSLINPLPENVIPHLPDWTLCQTASSVTNSAILEERHKENFNPHVAIPVSWDSTDEALSMIVSWCPWLIGAGDRKSFTQPVGKIEDYDLLPHRLDLPHTLVSENAKEMSQRKELKKYGDSGQSEQQELRMNDPSHHVTTPLQTQNKNHEEKVNENQLRPRRIEMR
jgi:energy-coupling factor transporter ATP-binding protein EcfA2